MKEAKLIMKELGQVNTTIGLRHSTLVGILPNGDEVKALTDSIGPRVVIQGESTHPVSPILKSHQDAISRGKVIIAADRADVYSNWTDLNKETVGPVGPAMIGMAFDVESQPQQAAQ